MLSSWASCLGEYGASASGPSALQDAEPVFLTQSTDAELKLSSHQAQDANKKNQNDLSNRISGGEDGSIMAGPVGTTPPMLDGGSQGATQTLCLPEKVGHGNIFTLCREPWWLPAEWIKRNNCNVLVLLAKCPRQNLFRRIQQATAKVKTLF
jgi:hypothetical protein